MTPEAKALIDKEGPVPSMPPLPSDESLARLDFYALVRLTAITINALQLFVDADQFADAVDCNAKLRVLQERLDAMSDAQRAKPEGATLQ